MTAKVKRARQSAPRVAILKRPHRVGCSAVRSVRDGYWTSPWWEGAGRVVVYADAAGRAVRRGFRRWLVLECNSTGCHARAWIRLDAIAEMAERALARTPARARRKRP